MTKENSDSWPLWEVFVRSKNGLSHKHAGSLHAPDEDMALKNARDVYTRRSEGVSIWVVLSSSIKASSPEERGRRGRVRRGPTSIEPPKIWPGKSFPQIAHIGFW